MAVNVKTQDFEEQVAKASGPVLVVKKIVSLITEMICL